MQLISLSEFVLSQSNPDFIESNEFEYAYRKIYNYANFLKQPLKLEMFVVVKPDLSDMNGRQYDCSIDEDLAWGKYQQAKKEILFKDFILGSSSMISSIYVISKDRREIIYFDLDYTIEDLIKRDLELTKYAVTQII